MSVNSDNKVVHFVAGAISGATSSFLTCPLDVAKTRLQSSLTSTSYPPPSNTQKFGSFQNVLNQDLRQRLRYMSTMAYQAQPQSHGSIGLIKCLKHIINTEGYRALFKGLMPTLFGAAPSRAIYFTSYDHCKRMYSEMFHPTSEMQNSAINFLASASAGFVTTTSTNPIWMIRTRLQLNNKPCSGSTALHCVRSIYQQHGLKGFYKGLVASYFGIAETAIYFVIYEKIKSYFKESRRRELASKDSPKTFSGNAGSGGTLVDGEEEGVFDLDEEILNDKMKAVDFLKIMGAGAVSKSIATCIAYPHEVVRTRLREENSRYRTFTGTILTVFREEGYRGLYRGLGTQLIKHIPNTAIVMVTYEAVVYFCCKNGF